MKSLTKYTPAFAIALLVCSQLPVGAAGDQSASTANPLSIVAQSSQQTYTVGDSVKIDVILRNGGSSDASIGGSAFDLSSFRFVVLDPSSHPLSPTPFARKLLGVPTKVKKNEPIKIGAGWQRRYQFELSKMFALTQPGMYSVSVKRVVVVSNSAGARKASSQVVLLSSDPIVDVAIAALLTWAAYSSIAVVLLVMALAAQGIVAPVAALALVLGANLGNVIPQYVSAGTNIEAKRLAIGNLIMRGIGCLVALPLLVLCVLLGVIASRGLFRE